MKGTQQFEIDDYNKLLQMREWKLKRQEIIRRDEGKCKNCGRKNNLQVHHRQYHFFKSGHILKPWEYSANLLVTLCRTCHETGHKLYKIPTKIIQ